MIDYTSRKVPDGAVILARKSWTQYVLNFAGFCAPMLGAGVVGVIEGAAGVAVAGLAAAIWFYRHCALKSVCLYFDQDGVWEFGGVLPWKRGVKGARWSDLDEATFAMGFWGWLVQSHRIVIGHRFKPGQEIVLDGMHRGDRAVATINAMRNPS